MAKEAVKGFESATGFFKREISNVLKLKNALSLNLSQIILSSIQQR